MQIMANIATNILELLEEENHDDCSFPFHRYEVFQEEYYPVLLSDCLIMFGWNYHLSVLHL